MNLYTDLPAWADEDKKHINVVVDIPKGSQNKYEYDEEGGYFKLDRVLHHSMFYPFDYGFVPQTHCGDGDGMDVVLLVTQPTFPGCVVKARVIGAIKSSDQDGEDNKLIAVPTHKLDPRWDEVQEIADLPKHVQKELEIYFKEYKRLEASKYDKITIGGFVDSNGSCALLEEAVEAYKGH